MANVSLPPGNIFRNPTSLTFGAASNTNVPASSRFFLLATCTVALPTVRTLTVPANKTYLVVNVGANEFTLVWTGGTQQIGPGEMVYVSWSTNTSAHVAVPVQASIGLADVFEWEPNAATPPPVPPLAVDVTPTAFSFTALTNVVTDQVYVSNPITVLGIDSLWDFGAGSEPVGVPITVSGTEATYSINGAPFTAAPGNAYLNDIVRASVRSSLSNSTPTSATVTIGGVIGIFTVSTGAVAPDLVPTAFAFADVTSAVLNQIYTSIVTITGINGPAPAEIVGGRWSKNGLPYVNGLATASTGPSTTVVSGDTIRLEVTASPTNSTATSSTLTISGVTDTFTVTTVAAPAPDTTPNAFTFTDETNVPVSTLRTSNAITVLGINSPATITVTGGTYSKNGGAFTASAGTVALNDTVRAQHTSSAAGSTATNTVVTIGGVSDTYTTTTASSPAASTTPLNSPEWLVEAEDYAGTKLGTAYYKANYQTQFAFEAGFGGTVTTCSTTAQMNAAITAAKTDSTIKGINLEPGSYTWTANTLNGMNRTTAEPFVIRSTPGSASQAVMSAIVETTSTFDGVAFVDLEIRNGIDIKASVTASDILIERCTGWLSIQGKSLGIDALGNNTPGTPITNVQVRLCELSDHWAMGSATLTHGYFHWNVTNCLMEGNVIDHNGWQPGTQRSSVLDSGGPTNRKHNCYFSDPYSGLVCRFNWNSRASSIGWHMKHGGRCYRNVHSRNPINAQLCYGGDDGAAGRNANIYPVPTDAVFRDNLIISDADQFPGSPLGIGFVVEWVNGGIYDNNRFLYMRTSAANEAMARVLQTYPVTAFIRNNVCYQFGTGRIQMLSPTVPASITATGNVPTASAISPAAQTLAYDLGGYPLDAGSTTSAAADAWVDAYKIARRRKGVDIAVLKGWQTTINGGITP